MLVVEHDVPIACLRSGKSPADCVAAKLAELDALDQAAGGGKDNSAHERLVSLHI